MTDTAQRLVDEVTNAGFPASIAVMAAEIVLHAQAHLAGDTSARTDLEVGIATLEDHDLVGVAYTLALGVAIAARKPAAEGTYAVTASGKCTACGVSVTVTGGGIPSHPDSRIGDPFTLRCICEPWEAQQPDLDDDEPGYWSPEVQERLEGRTPPRLDTPRNWLNSEEGDEYLAEGHVDQTCVEMRGLVRQARWECGFDLHDLIAALRGGSWTHTHAVAPADGDDVYIATGYDTDGAPTFCEAAMLGGLGNEPYPVTVVGLDHYPAYATTA